MTFDTNTFWRYARFDDLRQAFAGDFENLSVAERAELAHCRHPERREAWMLSRALARQMIGEHVIHRAAGASRVEICSRDSLRRKVRPLVTIDGQPAPLSLSIAHTQSAVLVAVCTTPGVTIGADLVRKTALGRGFLEVWFDEHEREEAEGDEACRLWAVKEAVYKAANENDPFAPRQVCVRRGESGEYRCSYRGVELGARCRISTWDCDDHVAALAAVSGSLVGNDLADGCDLPIERETTRSELSLR